MNILSFCEIRHSYIYLIKHITKEKERREHRIFFLLLNNKIRKKDSILLLSFLFHLSLSLSLSLSFLFNSSFTIANFIFCIYDLYAKNDIDAADYKTTVYLTTFTRQLHFAAFRQFDRTKCAKPSIDFRRT